MSKKPAFRVVFKGNERKPVIKGDLLDEEFNSFDNIKEKVIEKIKEKKFPKEKISEKDKFVLEIKNYEVSNLESIWNEDTFNYF